MWESWQINIFIIKFFRIILSLPFLKKDIHGENENSDC